MLPRHLRRCPANVDRRAWLRELEAYVAGHPEVDEATYDRAVDSVEPKRPAPDLPLFKTA